MDKPLSLSVKAFLIRKLAVDLVTPETIIEAVVNHQFTSALNATLSNKSVEISGFGRFLFNDKRAVKRMEKYTSQEEMFTKLLLNEDITDDKRRNLQLKLDCAKKNIKDLKPKLNDNVRFQGDMGGMD